MAHPYAEHRQTRKEHSRVGHITKGYASGGAVIRTQDDAKVRKMSASQEREVNPEGGVAPRRADRPARAKGGRVKGNGKTIINVITGGHPATGTPPPMPAGPPMGIAGPPPAPPMAAKPPMPMPAGPMAGGAPPMPMRAKGGRVNRGSGGATHVPGDTVSTQNGRAMNKFGERADKIIRSIPNGPTVGNFVAGERARGGRVNAGTKVYEDGKRNGTAVSHDFGKNDLADIGRKKVITFSSGGRVRRFEASNAVSPASKLPGGGGGGEARLAKAHRAARKN